MFSANSCAFCHERMSSNFCIVTLNAFYVMTNDQRLTTSDYHFLHSASCSHMYSSSSLSRSVSMHFQKLWWR